MSYEVTDYNDNLFIFSHTLEGGTDLESAHDSQGVSLYETYEASTVQQMFIQALADMYDKEQDNE